MQDSTSAGSMIVTCIRRGQEVAIVDRFSRIRQGAYTERVASFASLEYGNCRELPHTPMPMQSTFM